MWGDIAIAFLLAFITAFVITPYSIRLAKKVGAVDYPNDRRVNKKPMPRLGGIAVIAGFLVSAIYLIITMRIENNIDFITDGLGKKLLGFLFGAMVLGITCYIDDVKGISPLVKLAGQLIAAIIVVSCGVRIDNFTIPFKENSIMINEVISYILTIGWIVGITNAINLIDGLDGLSSGITLIACISMLIIFSLNESPLIAIILGPHSSSIVAFISLIIQALALNMGGLTSLGANFIVIGFIISITTYFFYNLFKDLNEKFAIFGGTVIGIIFATLGQIIILLISGTMSLNALLATLLPFYLFISIIEGAVNVVIISAIKTMKPEIMRINE